MFIKEVTQYINNTLKSPHGRHHRNFLSPHKTDVKVAGTKISRERSHPEGKKIMDAIFANFPRFQRAAPFARSSFNEKQRRGGKDRGRWACREVEQKVEGGKRAKKRRCLWKYRNRYLTPQAGTGKDGKWKETRPGAGPAFEEPVATNVAAIFPIFDGSRERKRTASSICRAILKIVKGAGRVAESKGATEYPRDIYVIKYSRKKQLRDAATFKQRLLYGSVD